MALRLHVVVGQERLAGSPETALVGREESFVIGRDATANWRLNDPAREISARHCEIRFDGAKYTLHDLSTNGTFLNGASERIQGQPEVQDGACIELGPFSVQVSVMTDLMQLDAPASAPVQAKAMAKPDFADTLPRGLPRSMPVRSGDPAALVHAQSQPPSSSAPRVSELAVVAATAPVEPKPVADEVPTRITPAPKIQPVKSAVAPLPLPSTPAPISAPAAVPAPTVKSQIRPAAAKAVVAGGEWIERLAQGLGIPKAALSHQDPGDLAETLGRLVRDTAIHLQQQLEAKAVDMRKLKLRAGTKRRRVDPNPLKSAQIPQALTTMLSSEPGAPESLHAVFARSFAELAGHHRKLSASTAGALEKLGSELAPATLETVFRDLVPDSSTPTGKARLWDLYRTYWLEVAEDWPSGMREAFLQFQAEGFADASFDTPSK